MTDIFVASLRFRAVAGAADRAIAGLIIRLANGVTDIAVAGLVAGLTDRVADVAVTGLVTGLANLAADRAIARLMVRHTNGVADVAVAGLVTRLADRVALVPPAGVTDCPVALHGHLLNAGVHDRLAFLVRFRTPGGLVDRLITATVAGACLAVVLAWFAAFGRTVSVATYAAKESGF